VVSLKSNRCFYRAFSKRLLCQWRALARELPLIADHCTPLPEYNYCQAKQHFSGVLNILMRQSRLSDVV